MLKPIVMFAWAALLAVPLYGVEAARQPNVLFILTDDQGSVDVSCYGAKDLYTPNMDALAARGVRFTQFYSAAPVCSPSRAGILTGKFPQAAGILGNVPEGNVKGGMPTEQVTLAEVFRAGGYATGHVGKWHLGHIPEETPNGQGFDFSFGHMGGCIDNYSHFFYWSGPNHHDLFRNGKEEWRDGEFFGDLMVGEACKFIEANRAKPFLLYWAINMPHYPLQAAAKWREHYKDLPSPRNMYAAFVSTADEMIGQVVAKLDALNLRNDTIIVFMSDHGQSYEERTFGGGGSSGPYRGGKFSLFEGGIRVPAIISWPGKLPENQVRTQLATGSDWLPTLADLAKVSIDPKAAKLLNGTSIVPVIRSADAPTPHPTWYWQQGDQWAVRDGDWKLIGNPRDPSQAEPLPPSDKLFLANLKQDVGERVNLAAQHGDVVERLSRLHADWERATIPAKAAKAKGNATNRKGAE